MEQYWYIIKNQQHFGPYNLGDLKKLREQNKIDSSVKLWHPKWDAPSLTALEPPPLPRENKIYKPTPTLKTLHRLQYHELSYQNMTTSTSEFSWLIQLSSKMNQIKNKYVAYLPQFLMVCALSLCSSLFYLSLNSLPLPPRPQTMAPTQYKNLQHFWQNATPSENEALFSLVTSKDFKTVWLAQKSDYSIVGVKLQGDSENLMSNLDFEKSWNLKTNERLISLTFDRNEQPTLGFYTLNIEWIKPNAWSLTEEKILTQIEIKIGHTDDKQLKTQVAKFHTPTPSKDVALEQTQRPLMLQGASAEIREKYQTLSSIIMDIKKNWMEMRELSHPKLAKAMNSFQIQYAKSTGSFLTALVLNNEKEIKQLSTGKKAVNTALIAHLHNLTEKAKLTGVLSADLMSNYRTYAKNPQKFAHWDTKISSLEKDLLDKLKQL
jgi:hypothetical protein